MQKYVFLRKLCTNRHNDIIERCEKGELSFIKIMIESGIYVNSLFGKDLLLNVAVKSGNIEMVSYLLSKGANPTLKDLRGCDAFDYCVNASTILSLLLIAKEDEGMLHYSEKSDDDYIIIDV